MTNINTESDNWGQLLSDFGIEDQIQEESPKQEEKAIEPVRSERPARHTKPMPEPETFDHFGAGVTETDADNTEESSAPKEKKSIFSRFPKINFFGAPPDVSLDAVIEGTKSPSLGGKAFTDNKLEKMPVSQERTDRQKKNRREPEPNKETDAWSTVASQIDVLASGGDAKTKPAERERPARRTASSMFDDPLPESDEARALKNLMGEQPSRKESHRGSFREEESDFRQRGRGRRQPPSEEREEREVRGRGSRYQPPVEVDDVIDSDFEPVEEETPRTRGRGRRGSKYEGGGYRDREPIRDNAPQEEWSEVDAALQAGRNDMPQRGEGGRRQRYDKRRGQERMEAPRIDRDASDNDDSGIVAVHGDIPSWDDAIGNIISGNIAKHKGSSHSGRGRR